MSPPAQSTSAGNRKSAPCRWYNQGHCRYGDKCKFSHDGHIQHGGKARDTLSNPAPSDLPTPSTPSHDSSDARPRPKRGETPCRAWKAGTCTRGAKCWFSHDVERPGVESPRPHKQKTSAAPCLVPLVQDEGLSGMVSLRSEHDLLRVEQVRAQEAEAAAAAAREHEKTIREEAAKTITQVVFGSIVTYSAGLDVPNLITGFETCTLRIENLPFDAKEDDVHAWLSRQDLGPDHFHLAIKKRSGRGAEAKIITDMTTGRELALRLDGVSFQDEILIVEMSATNSLEGMNASTGQSSEILTISWRAPSTRYIAEYFDTETARAKIQQLDRRVYENRRIKVEMNTQPRGRLVVHLPQNAIKINNLPLSVTDEDILQLTGSTSVRRLPVGGAFGMVNSTEQIVRLVLDDIGRAVPGGLKKFDDPPSTCSMEGVVSARAHFSSWDEAHTAYTHLSDKRYANQPIWLRLPDPMYFTLVIPPEQYKVQKAQWDSLSSSIKDRKACALSVRHAGNVVIIRLSGSVKEATGALKVRVENLARGEKVEGWHRSLGNTSSFISRVHSETGAYLRADWKRQSLKVYGAPRAIDEAREMIKNELERLSSLDYTVTLARNSVGFFVREGIQQLKETLGENNVKFAMASRKITVSGGEEARHALDHLITLSRQGTSGLPNPSQGSQTCPICYDDVSSPRQLGCGHTYCVACLRHFISSAVESDQLPLTCLGDEARCQVPIAIPTIQQFLPTASFNRLLEAAFDAYIGKHPEEFKHCKTPDCTQIYRAVKVGATPKTLHCPSCFSAVCNACHEEAHDGLSCAEGRIRRDPAEQERLNDAWITSQGGRVKKCPQCSVPIEKLEGCNHMTCRCGAHICWRCMGVFTAETIYPHMHSAHGSIHGDEPVVPVVEPAAAYIGFAVNMEEQRELLRQAEARRAAAAHDARPTWYQEYMRAREDAERRERLLRLERQREAEEQERRLRERRLREAEWERRLREQRLLAEQRRREEERRQGSGWNCMIM